MPQLTWIGKEAVLNYHHRVPYRLLEAQSDLSAGDPDCGNLIVEGDNLDALKALLPYYAGNVKCIYIDPPYNTGNEQWVYNDNMNDPTIRQWLGKVVGGEGEDLSRHDKWLCMMWPRLSLLHQFLTLDGSLWMSIDDNEVHRARALLDAIFGEQNFVATVIWEKNYSPKSSAKHLSESHDYLVVYARNEQLWVPNLLPRSARQDSRYRNPDGDPRGPWKPGGLDARNPYSEGIYSIVTPSGRIVPGPPKGSYWRVSQKKLAKMDADGRIWWGEDGSNVPAIKRFLSEVRQGVVPQTIWSYRDVGHTQEAKKEIVAILPDAENVFATPKPTRLIERILRIATGPDDIVMDSFAGSGTTAHAVLKLNREDGGHRRFILVELQQEIARGITAARVRNAVEGYAYAGTDRVLLHEEPLNVRALRNAETLMGDIDDLRREHREAYDRFETRVEDSALRLYGAKRVDGFREGLGSGFRYCTLGEAIVDEETGQIRETIPFADLARYVFFDATGAPIPRDAELTSPLIGVAKGIAVYLLYNGILGDLSADGGNVLTPGLLNTLPPHGGQRIVYANASLVSSEALRRLQVLFRQIPYAVKDR